MPGEGRGRASGKGTQLGATHLEILVALGLILELPHFEKGERNNTEARE